MKNILVLLILSLSAFILHAQPLPHGIDPEVSGLYRQASDALAQRDYSKAVNLFSQAVRIQPGNVVLRRDLAYAYYMNGQFSEGLKVVDQVIREGAADAETYQIASALEKGNGNDRKSTRYITDGLKKHPASGLLYHTRGVQQIGNQQGKAALGSFLEGIEKDPQFAGNYLQASRLLMAQSDYIWASIYAETAVLLDPENPRNTEAKRLVLESIRGMYASQGADGLPDFKNTRSSSKITSFDKAVEHIWLQQFLVLNDNQDIENLIMFRTRFLLDWMTKYPIEEHSLFSFHDRLLTQGHFDAYNQFLIGAVDDAQSFSNWVMAHQDNYTVFLEYLKSNPYKTDNKDPHKSSK